MLSTLLKIRTNFYSFPHPSRFLGGESNRQFLANAIFNQYTLDILSPPRVSPDDRAYEPIHDCLFLSFLSLKNRVFTDLLLKSKLYEFFLSSL